MAMKKFGAYTDDEGTVVSVGDEHKKKDDGVTQRAIKLAEDKLRGAVRVQPVPGKNSLPAGPTRP